MPSGNQIPQAQDSNAAGPANAEADARRRENPVEPPAREPIGREENRAIYVEPPVPMGSLNQNVNEPHSNGCPFPPMQVIDDERISPPQPDLGLQALSVNPPIQLMVRSDLQDRPDARVSSLSVEIVGPGAGIYASAPVVPAVVSEAIPVQGPVPAPPPGPAPAPAPGPAPAPPPAPAPNPVPEPPPNPAPRPAPAGTANFEADQDDLSLDDLIEERVSSLSSSGSNTTTTSTESSDDDNLPLSFYSRGPFPKNGTVCVGFTERLAPGSAAPASGRFVGQPPPSQPIPIPRPSRAVPRADRWTDDESSDSDTEPVSKRHRQMGRRE